MVRHFILALVLATVVRAAAEEQRFEYTNEHFAITLSSDWKEVDAKKAPYAKDVLTKDTDLVSHAYQLSSETSSPAIIFVEIDEAFRIPEREVARLHIEKLRQTFLTQAMETDGLRLLDSSFNTNRMEVRMSATADYPKTGKNRQLISWFLTDKGSYSITCVAPAEHYKELSAIFTKALDTFYMDPSLIYRARLKEVASQGTTKVVKFRMGWVFGAFAAVVLLIARRFTRVNSDEV